MSEMRQHPLLKTVFRQFEDGRMARRDFLRYSTLLGLSATTAYGLAGGISAPARAQAMPSGGTLRIGMRVMEVTRPHALNWVQPGNITNQVVETLTRTGQDNITRPHLCESWGASDDVQTWTFRLRPGVAYRNGEPFTAEHAAWNFRHWLAPETGSSAIGLMKAYLLDDVETGETDDEGNPVTTTQVWDGNAIEVVDDLTLRLNLKKPHIALPEDLFFYNTSMLDPAEDGAFGPGANGTGAFVLDEISVGEVARLSANRDYWGDGPYVDELVYVDLGDDPGANVAAVQSRQVHGLYQVDASLRPLLQRIEHADIHEAATSATAVVQMKVTEPPFDDPRVRQAMRWALDCPSILQLAVQGLGLAGEHHFVCPIHPEYYPLPEMARDVEKARALLAEAGHPDGIDVEMFCKADPAWELAAVQAMAVQYAEAGIRVKINNIPSSSFWDQWDKVPLAFVEWAHRPLGITVLALGFRSGVPWNAPEWSNAEFDRLLGEAEGTVDIEQRKLIMKQVETIMQEDGPIAQPVWRSIMTPFDKRVRGFQLHPQYRFFGNELALEA